MVSVIRFEEDICNFFIDVTAREEDAERHRYFEFKSVRSIQKRLRGFFERKHITRLHAAAVIIQKQWRAYFGRRRYLQVLRGTVEYMLEDYYNNNACDIQRVWRGHRSRKNIHNQKLYKTWIKNVGVKNKESDLLTKNYGMTQLKIKKDEDELRAKENVLFILFKIHHLLRTQSIPGVHSILDSSQLSILEEQLKELNLTEYVETLHIYRSTKRKKFEHLPPINLHEIKWHRRCEEHWYKRRREGDTKVFADDDFVDKCKRPMCRPDAFRQFPKHYPQELENPPMQFPPIYQTHVKDLQNQEPFDDSCKPIRERIFSKEIHPYDFDKAYHIVDASETYRGCKYGPFKENLSKTDLFNQRHEDKCKRKCRKDGN